MEKEKPQDFAHHARFFPPFHFFVLPVFLVNFVSSLVGLRHGISYFSILHVFVAAALVMLALSARLMAIAVQDRVICLEVRSRLGQLLPGDAKGRVVEFTPEQLIGLRFASDGELAELAQRVLAERIADRKTIKKQIKKWKPDYMRA
jgi:hypothetical protein